MPIANPPVVALLDPERSLVVCFTDEGAVTVTRRVKNATGNYDEATLGAIAQVKTTLGFEFGVDDPGIGLLVETDGIWEVPWDEDRVSALGAPPFAFGNGPIGVRGNYDPKIRTRRTRTGSFSNPSGLGSKITITGLHYTIESNIPPGVPAKYFSLWLPAGSTGYMRFTNWESVGRKEMFKSV